MKKRFGFVLLLFAVLTIIYFRNSIFCNSNILITRHLGSDLYAYFIHVHDHLDWLRQRFVPLGNYWVPRGGGFPASPMDQLIVPSNLLLMSLYSITHNFLTALRMFIPLVYFLALLTTYWLGTVLFSKRIPSIVLAVAYVFSMYGVGQLEHLDLMSAMVFVPLAFGFFELMFREYRNKYIILVAVFAFLTYLTDPYAVAFLAVLMFLRFVYEIVLEKRRIKTVVTTLKATVLAVLISSPVLILQLSQIPPQGIKTFDQYVVNAFSQPPGMLFDRTIPNFQTIEVTLYLGISVVLLALLPILFVKTNRKYFFFLIVAAITMFYAAGHYGPINIAQFVQGFLFFLRVPGRIMLIGNLALAFCAAVGVEVLIGKFKWRYAIAGVCIAAVFCDLTIGYEPPAVQMPIVNNVAYQWIAQQQGDFKVVDIPSIYASADMTSMYTSHDTLGWTLWDYGYYAPMKAPSDLYAEYVDKTADAVTAAEYGIKYVIINTDQDYYATMPNELAQADTVCKDKLDNTQDALRICSWLSGDGNYKLAYKTDSYQIFENLQYQGFVYGIGIESYQIVSPNEINVSINSNTPTTVCITQSFDKGWKTSIGTLIEKDSEQQLNLPDGKYVVTLKYVPYEKSLLQFLIWIPLIAIIVWMLKRKKCLF